MVSLTWIPSLQRCLVHTGNRLLNDWDLLLELLKRAAEIEERSGKPIAWKQRRYDAEWPVFIDWRNIHVQYMQMDKLHLAGVSFMLHHQRSFTLDH